MQRYFVEKNNNQYRLMKEDIHHFSKVMRGNSGDIITCIFNGEVFLGEVLNTDTGDIKYVDEVHCDVELDVNVTLIYALSKSDKFDFVVQKATELGVNRIVPIITNRCVVKMDKERFEKKRQRFQKIAKEACQQCYRTNIPYIEELYDLKDVKKFLSDFNLVAYEEVAKENNHNKLFEIINQLKKDNSITIIVGSEGGFERSEIDFLIEQGIEPCSLGKRILRSETAPLYMLSVIGYSREVQ